MSLDIRIPAAQYLRMSTEHQQYSLANQSDAIRVYGEAHGFEIVRTYSDAARSGLGLKRREGLKQLLHDVVGGAPGYQAVLVYDVSRWGRFQDTDEAAHYEFLCKSAGVPVHYCAETFVNDGSLPSLIMKALKRAMAGEYSRELGVKVFAGLKRLAQLGFKVGGMAGYGLRRMLVAADSTPKQLLEFGERKSIKTDRIILVPGPAEEVKVVREIYRMLIDDDLTLTGIARQLNAAGITSAGRQRSSWTKSKVHKILTNPKYIGCNVWGRRSTKLGSPVVTVPESQWVIQPNAFTALVDRATFDIAQKILRSRKRPRRNEALLACLRRLLAKKGRLSPQIIKASASTPGVGSYMRHFGSLESAYELIGYDRPDQFGPGDLRSRLRALRKRLMKRIVDLASGEVAIVRRPGTTHRSLQMADGTTVGIRVGRVVTGRWRSRITCWRVEPSPGEADCITLLARLNKRNDSFIDFHILPNVNRRSRFHLRWNDEWLKRGQKLRQLSEFCQVVARVRSMG